ncbi:MAG: beta-ketoacyl synthase N-terminal-like domain-containing protein [Bryobacteraceae bacterium]
MKDGPPGAVAVIGMACVFPGAPCMQRYWENILNKVDAVSDAPEEWGAEQCYDPESTENDRTYCKRGGFLHGLAEFDPARYGIMPGSVDGCEPDHFLAIRAAYDALTDAGCIDVGKAHARTEVIIGRGTYVNRGNATAIQHGIVVDSVLRVLKQLHPEHTDVELAELRRHLKSSLPPFHADTAPGLVPNLISGRIANRLDLMGANYVVDAACASALVALDHAVHDLVTGRCDMAVAGGVHASTPAVIMIIFSQLKALSRKGEIRPFDSGADGTLLGEGVGMVVLKRLKDAERDGDRVYAVIRGVGVASDGRAVGLLAPRLEGEELALRRAYEAAGVEPGSVGLIEAHGTATPVGDQVEMQALRSVFGPRNGNAKQIALGSVKSMIGHTMPASGIAGFIKTVLALHHRVLPPTLHCEKPDPKLGIDETPFYINTETRPWIHGSTAAPRRAGVNAFGFGGINAHVVLEEYTGARPAAWQQHNWDSELFVLSAADTAGLRGEAERVRRTAALRNLDFSLKDLAWTVNCTRERRAVNLALVATSREDLVAKLDRALERLAEAGTQRIRDNQGIYYARRPLAAEGKLAFVFPGEGAQYAGMLSHLAIHFPEVRSVFDLMERAFEGHPRGYSLRDALFPPVPGGGELWSMMDLAVEAVFGSDLAIHALLKRLGVTPHAMAGHSTGENAALVASGLVESATEQQLLEHIRGVNAVFENIKAAGGVREGVLLTVAGAERSLLESLVAASGGQVHIALSNCPHQVVLCGTGQGVQNLLRSLEGQPCIVQKLPWARAYHTPWFDAFTGPTLEYFKGVNIAEPAAAVYSCATAGLYPSDPDEVRNLASVQWAREVRFQDTIERMYQDGVRVFVEAGPRGMLTAFIDDILRGKPHLAAAADVQHRSGLLQLHHLLGQLAAHGVPMRLEALYERRNPQAVEEAEKPRRRTLPIRSGLQPFRLPEGLTLPAARAASAPAAAAAAAAAAAPSPRERAMQAHFRTMEEFLRLQQTVYGAYLQRVGAVPVANAPQTRPFVTEILEFSPQERVQARHRFSLKRDLFIDDHRLGRNVSDDDPLLAALPVVPLTFFMEALAEAASLLEPGKVLAEIREFRLYRWITLEQGDVTVEYAAERRNGGIYVTMRGGNGEGGIRHLWAECTAVFADSYPQAPPAGEFPLSGERPSKWKPELLYYDGMFHGSRFQAVESMDRVGKDGGTATMRVLPFDSLIAGLPEPAFLTDPLMLDNAGQAVSFWIQEALDPLGDIFPYRVACLKCYGPPTARPGTRVECRVRVTNLEEKQMSSNVHLTSSGRTLYTLEGWEDRRFPQTAAFRGLRREPREGLLAAEWREPVASYPEQMVCCRLDAFSPDFLESSHGIWLKTLVQLVLSRAEREEWNAMSGDAGFRRQWLLGRCAAKDAVRMLVERRTGVKLCPADIRISNDGRGRPLVSGAWTERLGIHPAVSISHIPVVAAALADAGPGRRIGLDLESLARARAEAEDLPFSPGERALLRGLEGELRREWVLRFWCAKEAVGKALERGIAGGPQQLEACELSRETGSVSIRLRGDLAREFPYVGGRPVRAFTGRSGELVYSTAVIMDTYAI